MIEFLFGWFGFGIKMLFYRDYDIKAKAIEVATNHNLPQAVTETIKSATTHEQLMSALEVLRHAVEAIG